MTWVYIAIPIASIILILFIIYKLYNKTFSAGKSEAENLYNKQLIKANEELEKKKKAYRKNMESLTIDCRSGFDKLSDKLRSLYSKGKIKLP